jgi:hypothetical protein
MGALTSRAAFPLAALRFRNRLDAVVSIAACEVPAPDEVQEPRRHASRVSLSHGCERDSERWEDC